LPKPFGKDALIECLYQQIRSSRESEAGDGEIISEYFRDNPDSLGIVLDFVEGLEVRIRELSTAFEQEDFAKLEDVAHRLSGSAGLFGYPLISKLGSLLERSANRMQLSEAKSLIEEVKDANGAIQRGVAVMKGSIDKVTTMQRKSELRPDPECNES
jgi:HPt (histidine-containing phosphotransfer) domain-containing protein